MTLVELRRLAWERFTKADAIHKKALDESRAMTDPEKTEYEGLMTEHKNRQAEIQRETEMEGIRACGDASANTPFRPIPTPSNIRSMGEWAVGAWGHEERAMSMTTGTAGGFLVPDQVMPGIEMQYNAEPPIVRPRAQVWPAGDQPDAAIKIPALKQGSDGVLGGFDMTWRAEGGTLAEQAASLEEISLEPHQLSDYTVVTNQLMRNAPMVNFFLGELFGTTIVVKEDYAFLRGDGVGKPKGVLNSAARIQVTRNTASDVKFTDIATMMSKLYPDSLGNAIWVANVTTLPKLVMLVDAGNHAIYVAGDASKSLPSTLFGIPIRWTGRMPTLGNEGDLGLYDFSKYAIKDGSGPYIQDSEHFLFTSNRTVIRGWKMVDGQPRVTAALKLEDGSTTVSPFVVLS